MKKIAILTIILIMFPFSIIKANNIMIEEIETYNVISEGIAKEQETEEKDISTKDILSASIGGIFGLLGVIVGFVGLLINNKLAFNNVKKENIYNILMGRYKELIKLRNKYFFEGNELCPYSLNEFIKTDIVTGDDTINIDKAKELLEEMQRFFDTHAEITEFIINNRNFFKKTFKFDEDEFYNLHSKNYIVTHQQLNEQLTSRNYDKDILYNIADELSDFNIKLDKLFLKTKENMEDILF